MKAVVAPDVDSQRLFFRKLIESLQLATSIKDWDLKWGEPFLAVTHDHQVWVRVFHEESGAITVERLEGEAQRLLPLLPKGGKLIFCLPESWGFNLNDLPELEAVSVRAWGYSGTAAAFSVSELLASPPVVKSEKKRTLAYQSSESERLSTDEVRELAEIGLELKRFCFKQAS